MQAENAVVSKQASVSYLEETLTQERITSWEVERQLYSIQGGMQDHITALKLDLKNKQTELVEASLVERELRLELVGERKKVAGLRETFASIVGDMKANDDCKDLL